MWRLPAAELVPVRPPPSSISLIDRITYVRYYLTYVREDLTYDGIVLTMDLQLKIEMLAPLLGSVNAERVLIYILSREEGYARAIARFFGADPDSIQKQLTKFEAGGILISKEVGRTVLYRFNPRYVFLPELKSLLERALEFYPAEERERLMFFRRRPRRRGKPA